MTILQDLERIYAAIDRVLQSAGDEQDGQDIFYLHQAMMGLAQARLSLTLMEFRGSERIPSKCDN